MVRGGHFPGRGQASHRQICSLRACLPPQELDPSMMSADGVGPEKKIMEESHPKESVAGENRSASGDPGLVRPLFVDLDGTLIQTDLLHEAILTLAFRAPRELLGIFWGTRHSRAALKQQLARVVHPDAATLPYRQEVRTLIEMHRARGGRTVLATASDASWGMRVAGQLGIFDDVLASDGVVNCRGGGQIAGNSGVLSPAGLQRIRLRRG